jgi:hypothetical protein
MTRGERHLIVSNGVGDWPPSEPEPGRKSSISLSGAPELASFEMRVLAILAGFCQPPIRNFQVRKNGMMSRDFHST